KGAKDHALNKRVELPRKVAAHVRRIAGPRRIPQDLMGQTQEQAVHEAENEEVEEWSFGSSEQCDQQPDEQRRNGKSCVDRTIDFYESQIVSDNSRQRQRRKQRDCDDREVGLKD